MRASCFGGGGGAHFILFRSRGTSTRALSPCTPASLFFASTLPTQAIHPPPLPPLSPCQAVAYWAKAVAGEAEAAGGAAAPGAADAAALQAVIEKAVVMGMAVQHKGASGALADLLAHYAGLLVAQGRWVACLCCGGKWSCSSVMVVLTGALQ